MTSEEDRTRRLPPLHALRAFECAARHGSFQQAAEELCVTPAAISQQIRLLEQDLAVELFTRHHRRVALTEAGRRMAGPLHAAFNAIHQAVAHATHEQSSLRVSTIASFASKCLVPRLHRFQAAHPGVQIQVDVDDHFAGLGQGGVDLAIRYGPGRYPGLFVEALAAAPMFPVCRPDLLKGPKGRLREPADLRFHNLLRDRAAEARSGVPDWNVWLTAAGVAAAGLLRGPVFDSAYLAQDAAIAGHGVALGVGPFVADDLVHGRLVQPFGPRLNNRYRLWMVCQPARRDDPVIRSFREWLAGEMRAAMATLQPTAP
jgi:LysR family glycine cleavage system transcriptional activator